MNDDGKVKQKKSTEKTFLWNNAKTYKSSMLMIMIITINSVRENGRTSGERTTEENTTIEMKKRKVN